MTTVDLLPPKVRERLRRARPLVARLRRARYRSRRRVQSLGESLAERLRPMNIDSREPGRVAAAMTVSSTLFALLLLLTTLLVVDLYAPFARDALRSLGFEF